ncbi:hypothetical protein NKH33_27005 [Mesorhizobium sp. M1182]|uniref:hypothetical protein n=1 Tax=unclassified Mesorhizobium TaxID=325217 RepID=UPI00333D9524
MNIWATSYGKIRRPNRFIEAHGSPDGKVVLGPVLHNLAVFIGKKERKARQYIEYAS